jgi:hypothetical protein
MVLGEQMPQVDLIHSPFHPPMVSVDGLTFKIGNEYSLTMVDVDFNSQVIVQGGTSNSGGIEVRKPGVYGPAEANARFDLQDSKTQQVTTKAGTYKVTLQSITELDGFKRFKFGVEKSA